MDSDDTTNHSLARPAAVHHQHFADFKPVMSPAVRIKRELNPGPLPNGWHHEAVYFHSSMPFSMIFLWISFLVNIFGNNIII